MSYVFTIILYEEIDNSYKCEEGTECINIFHVPTLGSSRVIIFHYETLQMSFRFLFVTKWKIFAFYNIPYLLDIAREDIYTASLCNPDLMPYLVCRSGPIGPVLNIKSLLVFLPLLDGLYIFFGLYSDKDRESLTYHIGSDDDRYKSYHIRRTTLRHCHHTVPRLSILIFRAEFHFATLCTL